MHNALLLIFVVRIVSIVKFPSPFFSIEFSSPFTIAGYCVARLNFRHRGQLLGALPPRVRAIAFKVIAFAVAYLSHSVAEAQSFKATFHRISVAQGLASPTVNTLLQDRQGFIWVGTIDGLYRYDGGEFKTFKHSPTDSTTLSANAILSLCEDITGSIWVGTYNGGLNRLDPKTERCTRYLNYSSKSTTLNSKDVKALCVDSAGIIWIGTWGEGLYSLKPTTGELRQWLSDSLNKSSLSENSINSIFADRERRLWIGTRSRGICVFDAERQRFVRMQNDPGKSGSLSSNEVKTIFEDKAGIAWIGTANGLNKWEQTTRTFTHYFHDPKNNNSLSDNRVYAIGESFVSGTSFLWIGTMGGGINVLNRKTNAFIRYRKNDLDKESLSDDVVKCMLPANNNIWIGTESGGVSKASTLKSNIIQLQHSPANPNSIGKGPVYAIAQDRAGTIWIGTVGGGLSSYSRSDGRVRRWDIVSTFIGSEISALFEDSRGIFWVGSPGNGLLAWNRQNQTCTHYTTNGRATSSISSNTIDELYEDSQGNLWIATSGGGLNKFDRASGHFRHYRTDNNNPKTLSHDRITALREGRDGTLWVGTEGGGLNAFDANTERFVRYMNDPKNLKSLSDNRVNAILEDHEEHLWIATSNGLNKLDRSTGECQRFMEKEGLPSNYISAMLEDGHNNVWLVTTKGISKFSPALAQFTNFDSEERFLGDNFSDASLRNPAGEFLVGSTNGVVIFHPDSMYVNPHVPKVVITSFNEFGQSRPLGESFSSAGEIGLEHTQNAFSFTFASLDYANPEKNQYAYKLEGYDKEWIQAANKRNASYTNLSPGSYLFRVKGSNNDGIWNNEGFSTRIVINSPFWERWWFRGLVLLALVGIAAMFNNYRVSKLLEIERMRVRIASDLHDDIGSSLSAIALITEMVKKKVPANSTEHQQLTSAAIATRTTADALRDIVWIINPEHDKADDIILRMKDAASKLLLHLEYTFDCADEALANILNMEFRRNIILIYKEILNNITKHAQATRVEISVSMQDRIFHLRVKDNGVGFDEATIKRGNGLNNLRFRAEKVGGKISVRSSAGQGTTTELFVKIP